MKVIFYSVIIGFLALSVYAAETGVKQKIDHPKNAAGSDLIAETTVSFVIKKYADGSVQWVTMPGMQTVVSEKHVKVYNKQALNNLPKHLHDAHKAHTKDKGDGEVVSLPLLGALFNPNDDPLVAKIEGGLVGSAVKFVGGVITGRPLEAGKAVVGFGRQLVGGIKALKAQKEGKLPQQYGPEPNPPQKSYIKRKPPKHVLDRRKARINRIKKR